MLVCSSDTVVQTEISLGWMLVQAFRCSQRMNPDDFGDLLTFHRGRWDMLTSAYEHWHCWHATVSPIRAASIAPDSCSSFSVTVNTFIFYLSSWANMWILRGRWASSVWTTDRRLARLCGSGPSRCWGISPPVKIQLHPPLLIPAWQTHNRAGLPGSQTMLTLP